MMATPLNWHQAVAFCRRLSSREQELHPQRRYRLPTEAEWEYACRAGTTTAYSFGDDEAKLGQYAWYDNNASDIGEKYAHRVGQKLPNRWGLYDLYGNVWEWCHNAYAPYPGSDMVMEDGFRVINGGQATNNIVKDSSVLFRVFRGGSWMVPSTLIRPANREKRNADYAFDNVGFRLMKKVN